MKYFYTYVLQSRIDKKYYIGWKNDLKKRIGLHNKGKVTLTKHCKPFDLVYYEACLSKQKAIFREKQLKSGFGRKYITSRI